MLAIIFERDPQKFTEEDEEVAKIQKNNVSWPKNYVPINVDVKRPKPK